jgi:hypothetical protein
LVTAATGSSATSLTTNKTYTKGRGDNPQHESRRHRDPQVHRIDPRLHGQGQENGVTKSNAAVVSRKHPNTRRAKSINRMTPVLLEVTDRMKLVIIVGMFSIVTSQPNMPAIAKMSMIDPVMITVSSRVSHRLFHETSL